MNAAFRATSRRTIYTSSQETGRQAPNPACPNSLAVAGAGRRRLFVMSIKTALLGIFALTMFVTAAWVAAAPQERHIETALPYKIGSR